MELNNKQKKFIQSKLYALSKSKFRCGFHLKDKDLKYIYFNSLETIEEHAFKFIMERLADSMILNDGRQTPMKGHPVFIAQHATATCCRGCLNKWYHISENKTLEDREIKFIVALIMEWIKNEMRR